MRKRVIAVIAIGLLAGIVVGGLVFSGWNSSPGEPMPRIPFDPDWVPPVDEVPAPELVDLRTILQQLPDDDLLNRFPNEAYMSLLARVETGEVLGTEKERAEAGILLREVLDHHEKLIEDPFYRAYFQVSENLSRHPILKDLTMASAVSAPWIVFAADHSSGENHREPALKTIAERAATDLGRLYHRMIDLLGERFDLPDIWTLEKLDQRVLAVVAFRSEGAFDRYNQAVGISTTHGTLAIYSIVDRFALTFGELESPRKRSGLRYVAAQQILHAFRRVVLEREIQEEVIWEDRRLKCRLHWFDVGLAAMFADGSEGLRQVADLKTAREDSLDFWSLEDLLSIRTASELGMRAWRKGLHHGSALEGLFQAQAWAFADFLMNFEGGKYREKFLEYVGRELKGISGPDEFRKVFWGSEEPDLSALDREWQSHIEKLLAK